MRLKKKRIFYVALAVLSLPCLYCGIWVSASQWSFYKITDILNSDIGKYVKFDAQSLTRDGFPFSINWRIKTVKVSAPLVDKKIDGRVSELVFGTNILQPAAISANAQDMSFLLGDKLNQAKWKIDLGGISIKVDETIQDIQKINFELKDMNIQGKNYSSADENWDWLFNISKTKGQFTRSSSVSNFSNKLTTIITLESSGILFNPKTTFPLQGIENAFVNLSILGDLKLTGIQNLVEWRDEGGIIEIRTAGLNSFPIQIELSGTTGLDQELKPIGAGTILLAGADTIIDKRIAAGKLKKADAKFIRLALRLLPHKNNSRGVQAIQIPITAQNGELRLGPFFITNLVSLVR